MAENRYAKMKELILKIQEADVSYYRDDNPVLTDREYDSLVEELQRLERETGIVFSNSPTNHVSGVNDSGLKKVHHTRPMRSAQKTKSVEEFRSFCSREAVMLSRKLDGLTIVLRYRDGKLLQAITRGEEGRIGEDITHTVRHLRNVPRCIACTEELEVRGEGVISWNDFHFLTGGDTKHQPRSCAAGLVRTYTPDRDKLKHMDFIAFALIRPGDTCETKQQQLDFLSAQGFTVVEHLLLPAGTAEAKFTGALDRFKADGYDYPVDGIIAEYNDLAFGKSLGATEHHENCMLALKWKDETYKTIFRALNCGVNATGLITFTAEFDPVEIDGSMVQRADIHSIANLQKLQLGEEDEITVYKANMIVPQIAGNQTKSGTCKVPEYCPCCGTLLTVKAARKDRESLYCENPDCIAKNTQKMARFCTELQITGLSTGVLNKLICGGVLRNYADLFHLGEKQEKILQLPGIGSATLEHILASVREATHCTLANYLRASGIAGMTRVSAAAIEDYFHGSWERFEESITGDFDFTAIPEVTGKMDEAIREWYYNKAEAEQRRQLLQELTFERGGGYQLRGAKVAITGSVNGMNRSDVAELLQTLGAKVVEIPDQTADLLIVGQKPDPQTLSQALQNNVKIVTESHFAKLVAEA